MRRRAFGLRPVPSLSSRPFGSNPSRLRHYALCLPPGDRRKAHPRRAMLGAPSKEPNRHRRIGPASAPPRWTGRGKHAIACCGRLYGCVPSSTLTILALRVTKDGSRTHRPTSLWSFHAAPQDQHRRVAAGAFSPVVGRLTWPASGHKPEKPSCGDAEPALSPFGCGSAQGVLVLL